MPNKAYKPTHADRIKRLELKVKSQDKKIKLLEHKLETIIQETLIWQGPNEIM